MKRTVPIATFLTACGIAILTYTACQPAAPSAGTTNTANTNAPKEPPLDTAAIEKELLQLEREWSTAYVNRNADAVRRIEADDITVTYLDGTVGTKADDLRDIESGAISAEAWDLADLKVRVLDADSAVVTGRGIIKNGKYKGPDGRTQMLKPQYRFTDVFERRDGRWQAIASQATTIANPVAAASPQPSPKSSPSTTSSPTSSPSPPR
jgi:ketosteroid isomerase-like protein